MSTDEPKKLALLRIWQILKENSDYDHPMTQEDIAGKLRNDYGIDIERKAISRNIALLKEAGISIDSRRAGCYLDDRDFDDSELRLLIDGVLSSKHISSRLSKNLINRLCSLSNKYFKARVKHIRSIDDWSKTENESLFLNIELIDEAIENGKQLHYDYNKYGINKKLQRTSHQYVSPYQIILHNQRYYLMAYSDYWKNMVFHRLDHITNMTITDKQAVKLRSLPGYESGIDYKELASAKPYMYTDKPERISFLADADIIDQVIDWFGKDVTLLKMPDENVVRVSLKASPKAMEHWAMQYIDHVEIISPDTLRENIKQSLKKGLKKYGGK